MEEYVATLANFHKPKLNGPLDEASAATHFYDPNSRLLVHEQILSDHDTLNAYKSWFNDNKSLIKDKVVMDIGCGTGILSMMAAQAGAALVIGIEWSSIADYADQIVSDNYLTTKVFILKGRVEQINMLPYNTPKVDVIISLWMGYSLLQGDRLRALIYARDRWLKPMGTIIPDRASLYLTAISDNNYRENYMETWKNVYGYDMSCVTDDMLKYAHYKIVPHNDIITNRCKIKDINLLTASYKDVFKSGNFRLTALRNDHIQAFVTYFIVKFSKCEIGTEISTDPYLAPKFWTQTVMYLKEYITIKKKEKIIGNISFFHINKDARFLGIVLTYYFKGSITGDIRGAYEYVLKA